MTGSQRMRDFVEVAIGNVVRIEVNLRKRGYKFANKRGAIRQIPPDTNPALATLRQKYELVPALFYAWYDRVEFVDFSQDERQLSEPSDDAVAGLGLNCTLVFGSLSTVQQRQSILERAGFGCTQVNGRDFVPLGTYASNSMPRGVWLPEGASDPIIYDAGSGPTSMGDDIIRAIRAGGFPFWEWMFAKRRISSPIPNTPRYHEILPALLEGVVAI